MRRPAFASFVFLLALGALAALAMPAPALAAPPANDAFTDATSISSLPFTDEGDLAGTTTETGEPFFCSFMQQTVWYVFTPSSRTVVKADLDGSDPGVSFNAFQSFGGGIGGLGFLGCVSFGGSMEFTAEANTTYYIQAGSGAVGPAHLRLNLETVPPPPNDDFANATTISGRPFSDFVDLTAATTEAGELTTPPGAFTPIVASAWYVYTAESTESLMASASLSCCVTPIVTAYTGASLQSLSVVASHSGPGGLVFNAVAGTTYYFQLGRGQLFGGTAPMQFSLAQPPPPVVNFGFSPPDPSTFDNVQFSDFSFDPAQVGFASMSWQFGDGTSGTGSFVSHQYAADGDYAIDHTITTLDGRTASASGVVHVRTHDIAIVKFSVPTSARAGQTRQLTVGIRNSLYPENVQVQLYKSVPGGSGFQLVGTLTQLIPVRPANKTVPVAFSYTFSSDDAAVGKVTFQAVATIIGGRDALPADNTAIAPPTKVSP